MPSTRSRSFILLSFSIVSFAAMAPGSGTNGSIAIPEKAPTSSISEMIFVGKPLQRAPNSSGYVKFAPVNNCSQMNEINSALETYTQDSAKSSAQQ